MNDTFSTGLTSAFDELNGTWITVTEPSHDYDTSTHHYTLPVYGLPGPVFLLVHILALVSLVASLALTIVVLVFIFKDLKPKAAIWRRPIGERLVVYLAVCDVCYCCSHILDHTYMVITYDFPPDDLCRMFSFFLAEFIFVQSIIVLFTAVNAFIMVVKERRLHLGKYDWRLLVVALGFPAVILVIWEGLRYLGPSGPWCFIDMRNESLGKLLTNIVSVILIVTFTADFFFYGLVWCKITATARSAATATGSKKYHRSARVMMLFVMAYLLQWWPYCLYSWWVLFGVPHPLVVTLVVIFCNFGGGFNFVVYILVRRKYAATDAQTSSDKKPQVTGKTATSSSDAAR